MFIVNIRKKYLRLVEIQNLLHKVILALYFN